MHQTVAFSKHYTTHLLVRYPNTNPDHPVFFQLGYISKCFHSFQHLASISRMKHRLSKIYSNIASLSPRYILCIYIYPLHLYPKFAYPEWYSDGSAISISSVVFWGSKLWYWNWRVARGKSSNHPLSSPFLRPCFLKRSYGQNKKKTLNYRH